MQAAPIVAPGDAAGAGADGVDLDHRQQQRAFGDAAFGGHTQLPLVDEGDVGTGAAHIDAQEIAVSRRLADALHGERPAGRPGGDHAGRIVLGRGDGQRAAIGLHQQDLGIRQAGTDAGRDLVQVVCHQRHGGGVQDDGAHAFEFANFTAHLVRGRNRDAGQPLAHPIADQGLVGRIDERVEETDGDGLGTAGADVVEQAFDRPLVRLDQDFAVRRRPLTDAETVFPRYHRQGLVLHQVVHVGTEMAADLEDVAESFGGHQGGRGQGVLEHRVGDQGGAVDEQCGVRLVDLCQRQSAVDGVDQCAGRVVMAARNLGDGDLAGVFLKDGDVREGAANIHT